ncbi:MAG: creatininase family protein, partial [Lentisphaerae bacterium]|nr:creatininase family protein [Lentisphaerota bacterium]
HQTLTVIPFCERMILAGDHAGISETSFMLYLERGLVDMTRIGKANYQDHGWQDHNTPEKATAAQGEAEAAQVVAHLRGQITTALRQD